MGRVARLQKQTDVAGVQWRILREDTRVTINPLTQERGLESHSGRVGLGIYIFNDQNGLIQRTGAQFSYAYHVFINNRQLSFGLGVNTFEFSISTDQFLIHLNKLTLYIIQDLPIKYFYRMLQQVFTCFLMIHFMDFPLPTCFKLL